MNFNSAFKLVSSLLLVGGLIGIFTTSSDVVLYYWGIFLAGFALLVVAFVSHNAEKFDELVKSWSHDGRKR